MLFGNRDERRPVNIFSGSLQLKVLIFYANLQAGNTLTLLVRVIDDRATRLNRAIA
jgi:hypothetical protein